MQAGGKIVEIIKPENDCLEFKNEKLEVPPSLFDEIRPKSFGWKEFILGGVAIASSVYLLTR